MRVAGLVVLALLSAGAVVGEVPTGPDVGEKIPPFTAADIDGNVRDFENLKGPNGLVLLFVRSADW